MRSMQYIPAPRDLVLGTIIARHAEGYRVDIGSSQMASLDALAFESGTKRSKPNLKVSIPPYDPQVRFRDLRSVTDKVDR